VSAPAVHSDGGAEEVGLRAAMRHHAAGVAVITTAETGADTAPVPSGFTASSVVCLSLDPPLLAFSVSLRSQSWRAWRRAPLGTVHLLHQGQSGVSAYFAGPGHDRFDGTVPWRWSPQECPVLDDALAWLTIQPRQRFLTGDHATIVSLVTDVRIARRLKPLVLHGGGYATTMPLRKLVDEQSA
jgi:flavin reductase (DIM6/NTAB) family NADH-FMN oxidoreductase RutF